MTIKNSDWKRYFMEREYIYQCVECSSYEWQESVPSWVTDTSCTETPGALASHLEKITNQELAFTVTHSQYRLSKAKNNRYFQ